VLFKKTTFTTDSRVLLCFELYTSGLLCEYASVLSIVALKFQKSEAGLNGLSGRRVCLGHDLVIPKIRNCVPSCASCRTIHLHTTTSSHPIKPLRLPTLTPHLLLHKILLDPHVHRFRNPFIPISQNTLFTRVPRPTPRMFMPTFPLPRATKRTKLHLPIRPCGTGKEMRTPAAGVVCGCVPV
jgi:hypothetical protein